LLGGGEPGEVTSPWEGSTLYKIQLSFFAASQEHSFFLGKKARGQEQVSSEKVFEGATCGAAPSSEGYVGKGGA